MISTNPLDMLERLIMQATNDELAAKEAMSTLDPQDDRFLTFVQIHRDAVRYREAHEHTLALVEDHMEREF